MAIGVTYFSFTSRDPADVAATRSPLQLIVRMIFPFEDAG
jgi:hypothetical protein